MQTNLSIRRKSFVPSPKLPPLGPVFTQYGLSATLVALALVLSYVIHHEVIRAFGAFALLVVVVAACSWYLAPLPALLTGLLGTLLHCFVIEPSGQRPLAIAINIGLRCTILIGVVLAVNSARCRLRRAQMLADRHEASAAQVAAEMARREQDAAQLLHDLTLELRTLNGTIQLVAEAVAHTSPSQASAMDTIMDASRQLSTVGHNLRELARLLKHGP